MANRDNTMPKLVTERFSSSRQFFWFYWILRYPLQFLLSGLGILVAAYLQTWPTNQIGVAVDEVIETGLSSRFYEAAGLIFLAAAVGWVCLAGNDELNGSIGIGKHCLEPARIA